MFRGDNLIDTDKSKGGNLRHECSWGDNLICAKNIRTREVILHLYFQVLQKSKTINALSVSLYM